MIKILIITSLFNIGNLFGQLSDSLGIDNNLLLNRQEIYFLTTSLSNIRDTFDFANKKVAFLTGSSGGQLIDKQAYFLSCIKPWTETKLKPQVFFVRLTKEEKKLSNGYDAIVMSWVKVFTKKQRKRIVKQLSRS